MTEIMKSEVFFFATTIAVVAVSVVLVVAMFYVISILKDAKELSTRARAEGTAILDDIGDIREEAKKKGFGFLAVIQSFFSRKKSKKAK